MKKYLIVSVLSVVFLPSFVIAYFDTDLSYGSQGEDVVELQEFLIDQECLLNGGATGRYLSLTRTAVKCFQNKNSIKPTGYFGPVTRSKASELLAIGASIEEEAAINETGDIPKPADKSPILMIQQQLESLWAQLEKVNNEAKTQTFLQQRMLEVRESNTPIPSPSVTPIPTPEPTPTNIVYDNRIYNDMVKITTNFPVDINNMALIVPTWEPIAGNQNDRDCYNLSRDNSAVCADWSLTTENPIHGEIVKADFVNNKYYYEYKLANALNTVNLITNDNGGRISSIFKIRITESGNGKSLTSGKFSVPHNFQSVVLTF